MKRIKEYSLIILSLVMLLSLVGCNIIEKTPEAIANTVLAKIGDVKITRGDVDKYLASTLYYLKQQYGDDIDENEELEETLKSYRTQAIEALIQEGILKEKKDEIGAEYTDEELASEVEEGINSIKEYYTEDDVLDEKKLKEHYEMSGFADEEEYRKAYKENLIISKIREKLLEGVEVADDEIETYYNDNIDSYKQSAGGNVTHLLFKVSEDESKEKINQAKADCEAARASVLQGKTFQNIQDQYGDDQYCITEDLGYIEYDSKQYVEEFVNALKGLEEEQVSEPVQTKFGWHLIIMTNINKEEKTQSLEEVKETISEKLLDTKKEEVYTKAIDKYKKELGYKIYDSRY